MMGMRRWMCRRIGVSRQTINAIEGGKYSPTLEAAFQIARVLEKPLDEVFQCDVDKDDERGRGRSR